MSTIPIDKAMADKIIKNAKPPATGVMLLAANGKTCTASDMKMADGKSMVDRFETLMTFRHEDQISSPAGARNRTTFDQDGFAGLRPPGRQALPAGRSPAPSLQPAS